MLSKNTILQNIHTIVSKNVIGDIQLFNRYKGFRSELYAQNYISQKHPELQQLQGGIIIPNHNNSLKIYCTCIPTKESLKGYELLYKNLNSLNFSKKFLIQYNFEELKQKRVMKFKNERVILSLPLFKIYEYKNDTFSFTGNEIEIISNLFESHAIRGKNKYPIEEKTKRWLLKELNCFTEEQLLQIYVDRLLLDGFIGFSKKKGKISDIDLITYNTKSNEYEFIEIKEKDLPKKAKKGFGLDIPRLNDFLKIEQQTTIPYRLIVRHINSQTERVLIDYKTVTIKNFHKDCINDNTVEGGTGMRASNSKNPTLICALEKFEKY